MREYGQIQCSFWTDPDLQGLSNQAVLLAAYLLTGPHSNGIGCYRLPDGYIQADLGWASETISKGFAELSQTGFAYRCESTGFVLIPKFLRWNPIANGNVAKAREREFESVPRKFALYQELASELLEHGGHWSEPFRNRLETVSKGYGKQDPTRPDPGPTQRESSLRSDSCAEFQENSPPPAAAPQESPPEDEPAEDDSPVFTTLLTNDKRSWRVTENYIAKQQERFPAVDVRQQIRAMEAWLESNPRKRKTWAGMKAFVTNWLSREQNRGGNLRTFPGNKQASSDPTRNARREL